MATKFNFQACLGWKSTCRPKVLQKSPTCTIFLPNLKYSFGKIKNLKPTSFSCSKAPRIRRRESSFWRLASWRTARGKCTPTAQWVVPTWYAQYSRGMASTHVVCLFFDYFSIEFFSDSIYSPLRLNTNEKGGYTFQM